MPSVPAAEILRPRTTDGRPWGGHGCSGFVDRARSGRPTGPAPRVTEPATVSDQPTGARILVVDDTPGSLRLLTGLVESEGYTAVPALSGEDALELVETQAPDLVLLDLILPGVDGYEVCRRLRSDPGTRYLPVIVLTSVGSNELVELSRRAPTTSSPSRSISRSCSARVRSLLRIKRYHDQVESQSQLLAALNRDLEERVAEQVAEMARLSRLRRFFSPKVADLITTADEQWLLDTHRQKIAVLFCDLRGFTAFAHSAEPEDVITLLRDFHAAAGQSVRRHGASVGWLSGDGMMVFLNDPVPCDDAAATALTLADDLRRVVSDALVRWRAEGYDLGVGIGIAIGFATLGVLGIEERAEYGPIGSVVNLASRLCDHAADAEILISQSVHSALDDSIGREEIGPLTLRGFPVPVTAWRLFSAGSPPSELMPVSPPCSRPLRCLPGRRPSHSRCRARATPFAARATIGS